MPEEKTCPKHGRIPPDAPEGKCVECVLELAADAETSPAPERVLSLQPGDRIGPYHLLEILGEGGMGTVWVAEQTEPIKRRVALKVISPERDSDQVLARFDVERQALALMDHPNIAKIFDAGATETGRPFFVMELIKGVPITRFCDEQCLSIRERLELFVPVCQAIQHAHQKGVIHRDIKPGNVLVATYDGKPVPKVIDFGIAKAIGPSLTDRTLYTNFSGIVGTLLYMAPEQAEFNQLDIDTRVDIYSLGVLLFELLTGTTPMTREELHRVGVLAAIELKKKGDSPRPSTRLSEGRERLAQVSRQRGLDPQRLVRLIHGDLDWITFKALENERRRRYDTARELADDIENYLQGDPVRAAPPTLGYHLRKFIGRHRVAVATTSGFALLLTIATIVSSQLALWANRERAGAVRAQQQAEDSLNRLRLRRAEEFFESGQSHLALAMLARTLRDTPGNQLAQARLGNTLFQRSFPLRSPTLEPPHAAPSLDVQLAFRIASAPTDQWVATATNSGELRLFDRPAAAPRWVQPSAHTNVIRSVEFSLDGERLISAGADRAAKIWDASTGNLLATLLHPESVHHAAFSPDGRLVVTAGSDGFARCWDPATRTPSGEPLSHNRPVNSARFSPDGAFLVTSCDDGSVRVWSVGTRRLAAEPLRRSRIPLDARFLTDGHTILVTWGTGQVTPYIWTQPRRLRSAEGNPIPRPSHAAIVSVLGLPATHFHHGEITFTDLSSDGTLLATASTDRTARIWDARTRHPATDPIAHPDTVNCVRFSPDGLHVVTSTADRRARVWDVRTSLPITDWLVLGQPVWGVAFSTDGRAVHVADLATWEIYRAKEGHAPVWLADLAEALAGVALSRSDLIEPVPEDLPERLVARLRELDDAKDEAVHWATALLTVPRPWLGREATP